MWIQVDGERKKDIYFVVQNHSSTVGQRHVHSFSNTCSLYGVPSLIYSDNARAFVATYNQIKQVFVLDAFVGKFCTFNIKHLTIPFYSACFRSVWERFIKSVKCCLFKLVGRKSVGYFEFLTLLSDVQNAINSRPFTSRCSEEAGLDIITPKAFLYTLIPNFS